MKGLFPDKQPRMCMSIDHTIAKTWHKNINFHYNILESTDIIIDREKLIKILQNMNDELIHLEICDFPQTNDNLLMINPIGKNYGYGIAPVNDYWVDYAMNLNFKYARDTYFDKKLREMMEELFNA